MSLESAAHLRRAHESLQEARILLENQHWNGATSRGYYAMFQAGQAILAQAGLHAKTHRGLKSRLAAERLMEKEALQILAQAQSLREKADYEVTFDADEATAVEVVDNAGDFIARAERHLP